MKRLFVGDTLGYEWGFFLPAAGTERERRDQRGDDGKPSQRLFLGRYAPVLVPGRPDLSGSVGEKACGRAAAERAVRDAIRLVG